MNDQPQPADTRFDTRLGQHLRSRYPNVAWVLEQVQDFPDISDPSALSTLLDGDLSASQVFQRLEYAIAEFDTKLRTANIRLMEAREGRSNGPPRRITSDPERFTGEIKDTAERQVAFLNWWSQLNRNWVTDDRCFEMPAGTGAALKDFRKLNQIPGLLGGEALTHWRTPFDTITNNPTEPGKWKWKTIEECRVAFYRRYVTLDLTLSAGREYDDLHMGSMPFPDFASKLLVIGDRAGKTNAELCADMRMKVTKELSDQMKPIMERPDKEDVDEWVSFYTKLWNNIEEHRHFDKLRKSRESGNTAVDKKGKPQQHQPAQHHQHQHTNRQPAGDPMDLSRMDLHPGQCAYCKEMGHHKHECPNRPSSGPRGGRGGRGASTGRGFYNAGSFADRGRGIAPRGGGGGYQPYNSYPAFGTAQPHARFNNQTGAPPAYPPRQQLRQVEVPNPGFVIDDNQSTTDSQSTGFWDVAQSPRPSAPSTPFQGQGKA